MMDRDIFWFDFNRNRELYRQERKDRIHSFSYYPTVIMSLMLGIIVITLQGFLSLSGTRHLLSQSELPRLDNHAKCGLTTGGKV